ncbi:MAG: hypothetical protein P4L87_21950 [Formivibrio sp.]|nr:hypothetical protein [Formivibrio sp.]
MATIHYIESNPELQTPLRGVIAQIAIRYLELHAFALECQIIGMANPVAGLVNFYRDLGFTRQYQGDFHENQEPTQIRHCFDWQA